MKKNIIYGFFTMLFFACASYKADYAKNGILQNNTETTNKEIEHSFYLIGDAGNAELGENLVTLEYFQKDLEKAPENSTAIFLGDNIYPVGMPKKEDPTRKLAEHRLNIQIDAVKNFKGKPIFIPGNHDWYNGIKGLKRQEKLVEKALGKKSFLPEDGCGLKKIDINAQITLIIIDSKWFITDWDNHPTINEDCAIKTREHFLDELWGLFKKNRYKNIVVAMHHPLYSNGPHGGSFSFKDHMSPVPILGTFKNMLRAHVGIQTDNFNKSYAEFVEQIETIADDFKDNTVFVSGHEHNLQIIENDGYKQVVSGSGSKQSPALAGYGAPFTYGNKGYARLDFYKDGSATIFYYAANKKDKNKLLFSKEIIAARKKVETYPFTEFEAHKDFVEASIYPKAATDVSNFHKFIWGDLHREKYSIPVKVPVLELDKVYGGLTPIRRGGGNQTNSLRLENPKTGKQYVLRSMLKDGSRIMNGLIEDTFLIELVQDVFTMSHPYAAFVIPDMAEAANIYHTNPKLYYMPKQPGLGQYNAIFGGGLYLLEERPAGNRDDVSSFGKSKKIISTFDVLEKIRKNGKHYIEQDWVIRSRLFDMVIGDWDRHEDQWRWASFPSENDKTSYRPIPRDRDQPFSKFDGVMIPVIQQFVPLVKNMQSFAGDIRNMKWYNNYPRFFDAEFLNQLTLEEWITQAKYIQNHLTDEIIENAIRQLPKDIFALDGESLITKIKSRRDKLQEIAKRYYKKQAKIVQVVGTDKADDFFVNRKDNATEVIVLRKKDTIYHRNFTTKETKEIQLYGLNGEDNFTVTGTVQKGILIRLIGGQDQDTYKDNSHVAGWSAKTKIYDFKSKKNTILGGKETHDLRSDSYHKNTYNHRDIENNTTVVMPKLGGNPDDGFFIGATLTHNRQAFKKQPFGSQHVVSSTYYAANDGFDVSYRGEFTDFIGKWGLVLDALVTSDNYSINFFGWGNQTIFDPNFNLDYYRVHKSEISFYPALIRRFRGGNNLRFSSSIEGIRIEDKKDRNIAQNYSSPIDIFEQNFFLGAEANFTHQRVDEISFPTKGMDFSLSIGAKYKIDDFQRRFGYLKTSLAIYQNLVPNRSLVFASEIGTHINFGNQFEVYQAATLGGDRSLRGFNRQRFTGKESFYQSSDLRLRFGEIKNSVFPIKVGMTVGFDYGRVWFPEESKNAIWHTSYGGSFWLSGLDLFTMNVSYFQGNSNEDRFSFGFGFAF